jgi:hypothetical protein
METKVLNFRWAVPAATGVVLATPCPLNGSIINITMHFPLGCLALVLVAFGNGGRQICPEAGFIALNDATPTYPIDEPVEGGDRLWVEIRNTDGGFPHTISVGVTIVGMYKPLPEEGSK